MDNKFAAFSAALLIAAGIVDWMLLDGQMTIGSGRLLLQFIDYLSFWR
jgi:hypothetical protein